MAFLGLEPVQRLRNHDSIVLQERVRVTLEVLQAGPASVDRRELPAGELAGLFEVGELGAQLVEGDEALGGHVLEAAPLAVRFGELPQPRPGLPLRVAADPLALLRYHPLEALSQTLAVFEQAGDEIPDGGLELVGPVILPVVALAVVAVGPRAAVVVDAHPLPRALRVARLLRVHGAPADGATHDRAGELPEPAGGLRGSTVAEDGLPRGLHLLAAYPRVGHGHGDPLALVLDAVAAALSVSSSF